MAAYDVLVQVPEAPITETLVWGTDTIVADDGTVTTASFQQLPKRSWKGNFVFDNESDLRYHLAASFNKFKGLFNFPLRHMGVISKAKIAIGANVIYCNTARTDFRPGMSILVWYGSDFETKIINAVNADNITLTTNMTKAFRKAYVCPMVEVYSSNNAAVIRRPVNKYATATFNFFQNGFQSPFLNAADEVVLATFAGLPVLNRRAYGGEFGQALGTGLEVTDYGGVPSFRSRWTAPQKVFSVSFKSARNFDPADWREWLTFLDYCLGSTNPFYMPTWRADAVVFSAPASGGNQITLAGHEYLDHYWAVPAYRNIVITKPDGTQHFATASAIANVAGNDRLTFAPAVPAGDWSGASFSFLLKCRIDDDTVAIEHRGGNSVVTLNLRTTD